MTLTRRFARPAVCALFLAGAPAVNAQSAAEPASPPSELPPVEVTAKSVTKKQAAKKSQAKAAKKATPTPVVDAGPQHDARGTGVTNAAAPVVDYIATESAVGTKTDTPLRETPQSVSVVGREQMRDQGVQNLQEALRYMPGVLADGFGYDSRGDYAVIRGINAVQFIDGLRTTYGTYYNSIPTEPYALERVEVLRGPSSMLYGQSSTGGLINAVSKLPSEIPYREIGIEYGSFDFKQVKLDMTGPATADGKWLYRVVGLARDADTQVDFVENDRLMLAPSLTYRPTNDTSITVLGNFRKDETGSTQQFLPHIGSVVPNGDGRRVPRSTFIGEPGDYYDTESQSVSVLVDHRFHDGLSLHHASRYSHFENAYDSTFPVSMTPSRFSAINALLGAYGISLDPSGAPFLNEEQSEIARLRTIRFTDTDVFNSDTNLTSRFNTGVIEHKVLGGFDYMRYGTSVSTSPLLIDNLVTSHSAPGAPFQQSIFDLYNPTYGRRSFYLSTYPGRPLIPSNDIPMIERPDEVQSQSGLYIQDQLRWGPWIAVLGLRHDWLTIEEVGQRDIHETATTGRAALMYELGFGLSPYISYSESFTPLPGQPVGETINTPATGWRAAQPMEGEQVEVGVKYQPNGAPFVVNASLYELKEKNQIITVDALAASVQGVDVKVRGFEIEAIGKLTPELAVVAAYSYTDATFDKYPGLYPFPFDSIVPALKEGGRVDGIPEHLASLWAVYTFRDGPLQGLSFGGGVRYVGESESTGVDILTLQKTHVKVPSFTLFDAMVAYETEDWRWQLTAQNLEDKYHALSCTAFRGDCAVGQARTIITGFTYKF